MSIIAKNNEVINTGCNIWNASIKRYPEIGVVEVYRLKTEFRVKNNGGGIRGSQKDEKKKEENQKRANQRATSKIRELILTNNLKYHWTFHYGDDVEDREQASYDFMKFIQRLNYYIKKKAKSENDLKTLPYVAVMEIQPERKAKYGVEVIHFHVATDRYMPFWDIHKLWGHGGAWVTPYSGDVMQVSTYMTKYITKSNGEEQVREHEQKRYFRSRYLKEADKTQEVMTLSNFEKMKNRAAVKTEYKDSEGEVIAEWIQIKELPGKKDMQKIEEVKPYIEEFREGVKKGDKKRGKILEGDRRKRK